MTARGEDDDSRPSRPFVSQRPTARDVPIAKYNKEASSAPRGLRGPSLLPGQGAPERIVPEDIELAVLREADTLDGPLVARAAARRLPDLTSSPPPTPVSVEVPRVRSVPPSIEPYGTTPQTPSARSVQSGTLMSIGSVDPRAPTELSLPSPRVLSQSERAAYLGPGAVVDRTPAKALPDMVRASTAPAQRAPSFADRESLPSSEPLPYSSSRSVSVASVPPLSSARRSERADSPPPAARYFDRMPPSEAPPTAAPSRSLASSPAQSAAPPSYMNEPAEFQIHAELDAVPRELFEDAFDLRSVSTQREPLASRKPLDSSDFRQQHAPSSSRRDSAAPSERRVSHYPSSSSAIMILADSTRGAPNERRDSSPNALPAPRASVPVSWVLGAAAFAVALALLVAYVMRAPGAPEAARPAPTPTVELGTARAASAPVRDALPKPALEADNAGSRGALGAAAASGAAPKLPAVASAPRGLEMPGSSAAPARPAAASARPSDTRSAPPSGGEASSKPLQSIY
jgi:hypothetical protein